MSANKVRCRVSGYSTCAHYRGFHIFYCPPPIPVRHWDWTFFDGNEEEREYHAASLVACRDEIDDMLYGLGE